MALLRVQTHAHRRRRSRSPTAPSACPLLFVLFAGCSPAGDGGGANEDSTADAGEASESESEAGTDPTETSDDTGESGDTGPFTGDPTDGASCDIIDQDCPEGSKCVPYVEIGPPWDANKCVQVKGDGAPGDPCVHDGPAIGSDDCGATSLCWNIVVEAGIAKGTCLSFCEGSYAQPSCPELDTSCEIINNGVIALCQINCDPLVQDCGNGLGCYWDGGEAFQCSHIGASGPIPPGEVCYYGNSCEPGSFCGDGSLLDSCGGALCCIAFCDLTQVPSTCPPQHECVSLFPPGAAPSQYADVGSCTFVG